MTVKEFIEFLSYLDPDMAVTAHDRETGFMEDLRAEEWEVGYSDKGFFIQDYDWEEYKKSEDYADDLKCGFQYQKMLALMNTSRWREKSGQ